MLPTPRDARAGGRLVGRKLLRHAGGRVVRGRVREYSAALDRFVAVFDDGATAVMDWDTLEDDLPVLPLARAARRAPGTPRTPDKPDKPAPRSEVGPANRLAASLLRALMVTLVAANRSAHPEDTRSILRSLRDRSVSDAVALRRFAACGSSALVLDALAAVADAADGDGARADVGVDVVLSAAAAVASAADAPAAARRDVGDKMCALWRWQKGVGGREELEDAAKWALHAWRPASKAEASLKAEKRLQPEPKALAKALAKRKRLETEKDTREEHRRKAQSAPSAASPSAARSPLKPTASPSPAVARPSSLSPAARTRVPTAETPAKKPRPLLSTARDAPAARTRELKLVRFRERPRVLLFDGSEAVASALRRPETKRGSGEPRRRSLDF